MSDHFKASEYSALSADADNSYLLEILEMHLKPGASVLELGMGPGRDLDALLLKYKAVGSDIDQAFIDLYRKKNPEAPLMQLNAVTIQTQQKFDCLFSNKVLHQLSPPELIQSFKRQIEVLNPGGLLFHSFWYGDKTVEHRGKTFYYYTENTILGYLPKNLQLVYCKPYMQMIPNDSIVFVIK